jgi:hypothetical protein
MAIIACEECAREVSDKAACCPHCGVSIAGVVRRKPRRVKPWLYGLLIAGLLAWGTVTTLWLMGITPVPKQLVGFIGTHGSLVRTLLPSEKTVEKVPVVASAPPAVELKPVTSAVYRTGVEQLNQDYDANEVAVQSKIGDNPIRVSGSVAEINEDTSGHPVVTLHTGSDNRADMFLTDDQRSAAAQLSKEDAVEIQCNKMQRVAARLHGSGCALVLVDAGAKLVYLAVSVSGKTGAAPLYIVGPMSRQTCLASGDTIAVQVTANPNRDRILSKSCAATARESVPLEGCRLSSSMSAIPDLPTAHLWKYDCVTAAAETRKAAETATSRGTRIRAAAPAATEAIATAAIATSPQPSPASPVADSDTPVPKAPQDAASNAASIEPAPTKSPTEAPPAPAPENNPGSAGGVAAATVNAGDAGSPQQPTPAAVPSSIPTAPTPSTADDLIPVRTKDPEAADRIVSYCSKITSGASNPTTIAARCRRDEMEAWTRLIVQNEFPTLDETSRRKCTEPPFPDSFVARESCAKYQLHVN